MSITNKQLEENEVGNRRLLLAVGYIQHSHRTTSIQVGNNIEVRVQCMLTGREYPAMFYQGMKLTCPECGQRFTVHYEPVMGEDI